MASPDLTLTLPLPLDGDVPFPARRLAGFVRLLRDNGFPVGVREGLDALETARVTDLADERGFRQALRALLCTSKADWGRFDELFDAYWLRRGMN